MGLWSDKMNTYLELKHKSQSGNLYRLYDVLKNKQLDPCMPKSVPDKLLKWKQSTRGIK